MKYTRHLTLLIICIYMFVQLSGCSLFNQDSTPESQIDYPKAEVLFEVTLAEPLPDDTKLMLEVLDDVTGLYFNSLRFEMAEKDDLSYYIRVPFAISSEVKYRYLKSSTSTEYEFNSENQQVRYRVLRVEGPQVVQDIIGTWIGETFASPQGRIRGQVIDKSNNAPIPNLLICAGGLQTVTSSDGTFILEGLRPGVHNLVIYSMDGIYETFQQGALIADGGVTPVLVYLEKRETKEITFTVHLPENIDNSLPVRFISNLQNLGNAYADLSSGSAGSAANYPEMQKVADDTYTIKLKLPVGAFVRYKYSLGDGFWNSELDSEGNFFVRDMIVDDSGSNQNDVVTSFTANGVAPVTFTVNTPVSTPSEESVYIQFNPFGWMEPIPMVSTGSQTWKFTLYNPIHLLGPIEYRFCRNSQCEVASGVTASSAPFQASGEIQNLAAVVDSWNNLETETAQVSFITEGGATQPRPGFMAGVELSSVYSSTWENSIDQGLSASSNMGGDWVIFSPTWSASQGILPLIEPVPGSDFLWNELQGMNNHIVLNNQTSILFPVINYTQSYMDFWNSSDTSTAWWNAWYEGYQRFILNNADLANILGIPSLILGDPSVIPSMGDGLLPDGEASNAPDDADARWVQLISDVRARYSGNIIGVAVIDSDTEFIPAWLENVDAIYVIFSPSLEDVESLDISQLRAIINDLLIEKVQPIAEKFEKPILLGISYPSSSLAADGYTVSSANRVTEPAAISGIEGDLELQARIYNAAILSAGSIDWIDGFFTRGYYPYVNLQDASSSIYKKPAADILWFWYHFILNKSS